MLQVWLGFSGFYGFGVVGLRASGCGGLAWGLFSFLKFRYLEAE